MESDAEELDVDVGSSVLVTVISCTFGSMGRSLGGAIDLVNSRTSLVSGNVFRIYAIGRTEGQSLLFVTHFLYFIDECGHRGFSRHQTALVPGIPIRIPRRERRRAEWNAHHFVRLM